MAPADNDRLRIKYEVPLTWLLGVVGFMLAQAAMMYYGQQRQGELIVALTTSNTELATQIKALSAQLSTKDLKDVQHDFQLLDHERRIVNLESMAKPRN